jgi:hypothetical protein
MRLLLIHRTLGALTVPTAGSLPHYLPPQPPLPTTRLTPCPTLTYWHSHMHPIRSCLHIPPIQHSDLATRSSNLTALLTNLTALGPTHDMHHLSPLLQLAPSPNHTCEHSICQHEHLEVWLHPLSLTLPTHTLIRPFSRPLPLAPSRLGEGTGSE